MNPFRTFVRTWSRRALILSHRYLGIAISLMLVVWFASGIVMMYTGDMPRLDPQLRLQRLSALDFATVRLSPAEAAQRAGAGANAVPTLLMVQERPAYRFPAATVFADDGSVLAPLSPAAAAEVARRFADVTADAVHFERELQTTDQWTLGSRRDLPLYRFVVDDGLGTQLYVSPQRAEVVLATTSRTRALAWVGTIPHWLYFSALRANQPLWFQTVVWLSTAACVLAALGLVLAFTQFRRTRPFRLKTAVPYRGWMRWHYISGALFGVFALTWAFSGLMSMEPWEWNSARGLAIDRGALSGGPVALADYPPLDGPALAAAAAPALIKELGFQRIQGEHHYSLRTAAAGQRMAVRVLARSQGRGGRGDQDRLLLRASDLQPLTGPFSTASIIARIQHAAPGAGIVEQTLLQDFDSYYYPRRNQAVLPVLRIKFDDPMRSWIYVDPVTSSIVAQVHKYSRIERWLYNGLHSLDFRFWYSRRPLWDIGMIVLLLGGLASSGLGFFLGMRRLLRSARRVPPR